MWWLLGLALAAEPVVTERLLPFDRERLTLMSQYLEAHTGRERSRDPRVDCTITPRIVVLHWTGGPTADSAWSTFAPTRLAGRPDLDDAGAVNVSAHYLVDRDGTIYRLMPDNLAARHVIGLNHVAVGIENVGGPKAPLTEAQVAANAALVRQLAAKWPITHVIGHHQYRRMEGSRYFKESDPTYRTVKSDPGDAFVDAVRAAVHDLQLAGAPAQP
jgi:N-acetylmuramoyl-L-alanine amidase